MTVESFVITCRINTEVQKRRHSVWLQGTEKGDQNVRLSVNVPENTILRLSSGSSRSECWNIIFITNLERNKSELCLGRTWDKTKFVLITKKSVIFLSSVDHAKCDLLVSTRTKTCPRRQIFKGTVVLPRSTTFCEQHWNKNCFSCDKPASQFSEFNSIAPRAYFCLSGADAWNSHVEL